jgi:hypothetical protein
LRLQAEIPFRNPFFAVNRKLSRTRGSTDANSSWVGSASPPQPRGSRTKIVAISAVLALITLALYAPSARHGFIDYDDDTYILDNPHVYTGLSTENILWAFRSGYGGNWHPITWISHMVDYQLFGLNPGPQHLINAIFHAANTVLLFLALQNITCCYWRTAFVAALFGFHPLHVESAGWLAERKDLLSALFAFVALLAYGHYSKATISPANASRRRYYLYAVTLLSYALGLMCKPMLVTLPFLLLLVDYWPIGRLESLVGMRAAVLEKLPFFVLSAISSIITVAIQSRAGAVASLQNVPVLSRVTNAALSYLLYLGKIFWPKNLIIPYVPERDQSSFTLWLAIAVLAIVTILVVKVRTRQAYALVGWFWYLGTLVPVIGLVQVGIQSMADRYTYLPSIGIYFLVTWTMADLLRACRVPIIFTASAAAAVLCILSALTVRQLSFWKNSETLFFHSVSVDPTNLLAVSSLAWTYATDPDPQIRDGRKAIQLAQFCVEQTQSQEPVYLDILAAAYAETGQFRLALETASQALRLAGPNQQSQFISDVKARIELYKASRAVHKQ